MQVLKSSIRAVALQYNLTEEIIENMLKDEGNKYEEQKPKNLKKLGIDEIALVKGQKNYCCVLVDLETRQLITLLPSRKQEVLREYFEQWGEEILE